MKDDFTECSSSLSPPPQFSEHIQLRLWMLSIPIYAVYVKLSVLNVIVQLTKSSI